MKPLRKEGLLLLHHHVKKVLLRGLPGGRPLVKSLTCSARDTGLMPGWGTKIPHSMGATTEPLCSGSQVPQ